MDLPCFFLKGNIDFYCYVLNVVTDEVVVHIVSSSIFWLNEFIPSTPGAGLPEKKGHRKLVLVTMVDQKKVFCLQTG